MAGYIFSIDNMESLNYSIQNGVYSTIIKKIPKNNIWSAPFEGTFADYITMQKGDNIFFFHKRKIYGIGELININDDCKYLNFPGSDLPYEYKLKNKKEKMILNKNKEDLKKRVICTFKSSPYFFGKGVDMDEVLSSNPSKFKMLRAFWKTSFIKIDDEENQALIDVMLKNNEKNIQQKTNVYSHKYTIHNRIRSLVTSDKKEKYNVISDHLMNEVVLADGGIRHEMALEAGVLDYMINKKGDTFGFWDYLSRQVIASPFKPIDYMDRMDIFGYKYIPGFKTVSRYLVIELKKGAALEEDINQVMKYVDWVNQEYSYGDYNMIEAYLIAYSFPDKVVKQKEKAAIRTFVKGTRPAESLEWKNLKLVQYRFTGGRLKFDIV